MALIFWGKSTCPLCGNVLLDNQKMKSFPAFLRKTHALAWYSDAAFHKECFDKSADAIAVTELYDGYRQIWTNRPRNLKTQKEIDEWGKSAFTEFG